MTRALSLALLLAGCAAEAAPCQVAPGTWVLWSPYDTPHLPITVEVDGGGILDVLERPDCPGGTGLTPTDNGCAVLVNRSCDAGNPLWPEMGYTESGGEIRWRNRFRFEGPISFGSCTWPNNDRSYSCIGTISDAHLVGIHETLCDSYPDRCPEGP